VTPDSGQRVHVLRFAAPGARESLTALWTVADEIHASARPALDHTVAHARLAWWQEECARTARGAAVHPLTTLLSRCTREMVGVWPQLGGCVHAAVLELAHAPLSTAGERRAYADASLGTMFRTMAQLLGASSPESEAAGQLGTQMRLLQLDSHAAGMVASVRAALTRLPPAAQPGLRPLLVWVALLDAESRTAGLRALSPQPNSLRQELGTTVRAWRAAVAATRGRFQLPGAGK
jgi:hypothetical protein